MQLFIIFSIFVIFFFQTTNQQPINPYILEQEILDKIDKHGTVINIFEASNDKIKETAENYDFIYYPNFGIHKRTKRNLKFELPKWNLPEWGLSKLDLPKRTKRHMDWTKLNVPKFPAPHGLCNAPINTPPYNPYPIKW